MAERQAKDLTTGPIGKHLLYLSLPLLGSSFLQLLYSFIDMAWLGRLSGEAVAAAGAASVFTWLANSLSLLNKVASEVGVANALGRGAKDEARSYASHTSTMALILGITLLLIYFLFANPLIGFYRLAPEIHDFGTQYLEIAALGMPFVFMGAAYTGIYNATGHSKVPFVVMTIGVVTNIILDPIFIFVLEMGVAGAAWATIISQALGCSLILYQMLLRDKLLGGIKIITQLKKRTVRHILSIGTPVALMNSLFAFINMNLGRIASLYGGYIGVMTLTTGGQLEGLCWNTAQGFSTALSAFTGQNYGADKPERIYKGVRYTLSLSLSIGIIGFLIYFFLGEKLFALIVPEEAAYIAGGIYLHIQALPQLFSMLEITSQGFFYGIRKTLPPSLISIIGNLLRIPAAYIILPLTNNIISLWWIIAISTIVKGLMAAAYYFYIKHKGIISERRPAC